MEALRIGGTPRRDARPVGLLLNRFLRIALLGESATLVGVFGEAGFLVADDASDDGCSRSSSSFLNRNKAKTLPLLTRVVARVGLVLDTVPLPPGLVGKGLLYLRETGEEKADDSRL